MKKRRIKQVGVFLFIFVIAIFYELSNKGNMQEVIPRGEPMTGEEEIALILNADGLPKDYVYNIQVKEMLYTQSEAEKLLEEAKAQIDSDFACGINNSQLQMQGELRVETSSEATGIHKQQEQVANADYESTPYKMNTIVPARDSYVSDKVEAEWSFSPSGYIDTNFEIREKEIPKEGVVINAFVTLTCGTYEERYTFAFLIEQKELTQEEQFITSLDEYFETEMQKEGNSEILLPKELNGVSLHWTKQEESISLKVFCFGIVVLLLLHFREKEQKEEQKREYLKGMEQDYPEIVGSLSVLMGAGMGFKQAWNVMTGQYIRKTKRDGSEKRAGWEEVLLVNRKIQEGAGEKEALLQMMERIPLMCYHRLIRMLLLYRENGAKGLCEMLDKEAQQAYEQRMLYVRKLGEEASTKLLMPMMIMLFIVMAIVLLPACINFSV